MKKNILWMLAAILTIACGACVITCCDSKGDDSVVSPTDDSSQFVTLSEAVPDAILEIRYYGTFNFVWDSALMDMKNQQLFLPNKPQQH